MLPSSTKPAFSFVWRFFFKTVKKQMKNWCTLEGFLRSEFFIFFNFEKRSLGSQKYKRMPQNYTFIKKKCLHLLVDNCKSLNIRKLKKTLKRLFTQFWP
jgi:hypothetical protein